MTFTIPITSISSLFFTFLIIYLALKVVSCRKQFKIGFGDANNDALQKALSAHSNAIENIPLFIVLLLMLEINNAEQAIVIIIAVVFSLARLIHAFGLLGSIGVSFGRTYGTVVSWFTLILMGVLNVVYTFV